MEKILITGATGEYGKAVITALIKKGADVKSIYAMVRDSKKIQSLVLLGVTVIYGDYDDYDSLLVAFSGFDKVLFVSSTKEVNRYGQQKLVVKAAKKVGVRHIIYTSQLHRTDRPKSPIKAAINSHLDTENAIKRSGMRYTILRNGPYLDLLPAFLGDAVLRDGIRVPAGEGKTAFTLRNDLAEAAAQVIISDAGRNKTYELCGMGVTYHQIAECISVITGSEVPYESIAYNRYIDNVTAAGLPRSTALTLAAYASAAAQGELDSESTQLELLLGRAPMGVEEFLLALYKKGLFQVSGESTEAM